jgi:hypothetical protein
VHHAADVESSEIFVSSVTAHRQRAQLAITVSVATRKAERRRLIHPCAVPEFQYEYDKIVTMD